MNKPSSKLTRGPQTGAPPSLEQVALDRLQVDPAYQRATDGPLSRKLIVSMVREWKWALCQPLVIARRDDGSLWILDGQHRHAGAVERGDIAYLPCVIMPAIGAETEARTFVDLNTKRQRLTQTEIFCGMLAAGDAKAKRTAELLEETGWRIVRTNTTSHWRPGDIASAPAVATLLRIHGEAAVREALLCLRQAYPDTVVTAPANLIGALVHLFREGGIYAGKRETVAAGMAKMPPGNWRARADAARAEDPSLSTRDAYTGLLVNAATRAVAAPITAPVRAPHLVPAPIASKGTPVWCEQCDTRVTPEAAARCNSPFCRAQVRAA